MMSDYMAIEHDAETDESVERVMTQDEIEEIMALSAALMQSVTIETANEPMPFEPLEPNPLPESDEP